MKNTESSNTNMNAEEMVKPDLNYELIERKEIENTPFEMIKIKKENDKEISFIAWGRFRLTEEIEGREIYNIVNKLEDGKMNWDIVGAMIACVTMNINN